MIVHIFSYSGKQLHAGAIQRQKWHFPLADEYSQTGRLIRVELLSGGGQTRETVHVGAINFMFRQCPGELFACENDEARCLLALVH